MSSQCAPSGGGSTGNTAVAFGLVTAAGLSTSIGAALAFVMPKRTGTTNLFLAASLGSAAGVMLYVSFVEIFGQKAVQAIALCVPSFAQAYLYASLCFFGGVLLMAGLDYGLHQVEHCIGRRAERKERESGASMDTAPEQQNEHVNDGEAVESDDTLEGNTDESKPTAAERDEVKESGIGILSSTDDDRSDPMDSSIPSKESNDDTVDSVTKIDDLVGEHDNEETEHRHDELGHDGQMIARLYQNDSIEHDGKKLIRMGLFTGLAIAFHNFPEGLATFVAALEDSKVGAAVAIAIGIHNIPEGICVAMPIYYATGSRKKAFFWATLSGVTELLGAALGWAVLRKVFNQLVYGILFGVVAGMMVYISVKELFPMAHRYDPEDRVTTIFFVLGMSVMAASLVLFQF